MAIFLAAAGASAHAGMPAIGPYLIAGQAREVAMARSAAPAAISAHATVLVLGRRGYLPR